MNAESIITANEVIVSVSISGMVGVCVGVDVGFCVVVGLAVDGISGGWTKF